MMQDRGEVCRGNPLDGEGDRVQMMFLVDEYRVDLVAFARDMLRVEVMTTPQKRILLNNPARELPDG
jgi:hypothetical protein